MDTNKPKRFAVEHLSMLKAELMKSINDDNDIIV